MSDHEHHSHQHAPASSGALVKDPVCGMDVDPSKAAGSVEYEGNTYYFCGKKCVARFTANPRDYVDASKPAKERAHAIPAAPRAKYTCPMHPEIVRDGPGS